MKSLMLCLVITFSAKANAEIINGGFEDFPVEENNREIISDTLFPGWKSSNTFIDIWGNMHNGVPSFGGGVHVMLSKNISLYQDVDTFLNDSIFWSFSHRPRSGWDILQFTATDLGFDQVYGTSDDRILEQKSYRELLPRWNQENGYLIGSGNKLRFEFYSSSVTSGNNGNNTIGNFVDSVQISFIPTPATVAILALGCLIIKRRR